MIQVIPAIDLIVGHCVRLSQGDFNREICYDSSPERMALSFLANGLKSVHVVDLDGARLGAPANLDVLKRLSRIEGLEIEWGGAATATPMTIREAAP